jgi:hypothetical protein
MTRTSGSAEQLSERRQPGARRAALEQAAGEPDRVDDGPGEPCSRQPLRFAVEKREVEAGVVCNEDGVPRELQEAPDGDAGVSLPAQFRVAEAGEGGDRRRKGDTRIDEQLEPLSELELMHPHRPDLADV